MSASTVTLSSFILARVGEDQAVAEAATIGDWEHGEGAARVDNSDWVELRNRETIGVQMTPANATHIARSDPARVLATCKAHRAIVEEHAPDSYICCWTQDSMSMHDDYVCPTLRALAAIWADHADFDNERWGT